VGKEVLSVDEEDLLILLLIHQWRHDLNLSADVRRHRRRLLLQQYLRHLFDLFFCRVKVLHFRDLRGFLHDVILLSISDFAGHQVHEAAIVVSCRLLLHFGFNCVQTLNQQLAEMIVADLNPLLQQDPLLEVSLEH
jgi:hypothetical protein